jgi:hypothetical protein
MSFITRVQVSRNDREYLVISYSTTQFYINHFYYKASNGIIIMNNDLGRKLSELFTARFGHHCSTLVELLWKFT